MNNINSINSSTCHSDSLLQKSSKFVNRSSFSRPNEEIFSKKFSSARFVNVIQPIFKFLSQLFECIYHYTRLLAKGLISIKTKLIGMDLHFHLFTKVVNVNVYQSCRHLENPHSENMCLVK
ncbi:MULTISPECIES: hypothetical protein [Candidatus Protochlamydia]|uniref:Uncharacterized protein n=1 Tax=Candidatus Protochlamydia amoebophila TaxID=362787 RepID=A0A0C1JKE3_9BACT|nr:MULTISPECIES: hypothetical protein [Protochlamydia]KIC71061.1 hypothetical protein DB44_EV00040 [Candidatus Protochlamydia amoebophila]